MSKAILVLDEMPVECRQCIFDRIGPTFGYEYCEITHSLITNPDEKSDGCTLRMFPNPIIKLEGEESYKFADGWNTLLKLLEADDE